MRLPGAFNADQHDDMDVYDVLPADEYIAQIVKSEVAMTKKAKEANDPDLGQRLNLTFEVLEGKYKGRKFFVGLNIVNPNPTAVEISQKELATICRAIGKAHIDDTDELHDIPMLVKLKVKKGDANNPDQNAAVTYKPYGSKPTSPSKPKPADDSDSGEEKPASEGSKKKPLFE